MYTSRNASPNLATTTKKTMLQQLRIIKRAAAKKFRGPSEWERLEKEYAHHASPNRLDWNWKSTNYNRIAAVNEIVSRFDAPKYLEIGCRWNTLFDAVPAADKTGVDPEQGGTHRMTSDEFFAHTRDKFDVIFVDGLHTYDQVRRDVVNAIGRLRSGGFIVLHDQLPRGWKEQHVPRFSVEWNGDVWKVGFELTATRGIDFRIIKIDFGVGVLRLTEEFDGLVDRRQELADQQFDYFYNNYKTLPIVDWSEFVDWL